MKILILIIGLCLASHAWANEPSVAKHKAGSHAVAHSATAPPAVGKEREEDTPSASLAEPPEAESVTPGAPQKGTVTGLPLPRFAALRSDAVYMRKGPGMRYPIEWVYKRRDLPIEILREFDVWRLVKDQDGVKGWVHQATLTGRRSLLVTVADQGLHSAPDGSAPLVAKLQPGVIGRLQHCDSGSEWCQAQIKDYKGWISRHVMWGAEPDEAVQ